MLIIQPIEHRKSTRRNRPKSLKSFIYNAFNNIFGITLAIGKFYPQHSIFRAARKTETKIIFNIVAVVVVAVAHADATGPRFIVFQNNNDGIILPFKYNCVKHRQWMIYFIDESSESSLAATLFTIVFVVVNRTSSCCNFSIFTFF